MLKPLRQLNGINPLILAGRLRSVEFKLASPRTLLLNTRQNSTVTEPPRRFFQRAKTVARYTGYISLSAIFGVLVCGTGFFVHDMFTYSERHIDRVPTSPLALHSEKGGPKNLPIARVQVDDEDDEEHVRLASKPKLVIVGGGWGVSRYFPFSLPLSLKSFKGYGSASDFVFRRLSRNCHCIGNFHHFHASPSVYVDSFRMASRLMHLQSCGCWNGTNSIPY